VYCSFAEFVKTEFDRGYVQHAIRTPVNDLTGWVELNANSTHWRSFQRRVQIKNLTICLSVSSYAMH